MDLSQASGIDIVTLQGEIDMASAGSIQAVLDSLIEDAVGIVIDTAAVTMIDASIVRTLVQAQRRARERGTDLYVAGARGLVLQVFEVAGVAKDLRVHWDRAQAIDAVARHLDLRRTRTTDFTGGDRMSSPVLADMVQRLLTEAATLSPDDPRQQELRNQAVEHALPYARRLAWRYHSRGEQYDDLLQVAAVGLVKAVNGYNPGRGTNFLGYATPTVLGELRRHFRDNGWSMRVPRRLKDLRIQIIHASRDLEQQLNRHPTVAELARYVDAPEADVSEALVAARNYRPTSLSTLMNEDQELADLLGDDDRSMDLVDFRESIKPVLARLSPKERRVLSMRFGADMTQSEIAAEVGTSQMQVSRLLATMMGRFRRVLLREDGV